MSGSLQAFCYRIPLRPVVMAGQTLQERSGILLRQQIGSEIFWADAAPLPGFSDETLSDAIDDFHAGPPFQTAALQFAQEMLAFQQMLSVNSDSPVSVSVPINALLTSDSQNPLDSAAELAESSYRSVKLKVGRHSLETDIDLVRTVRNHLRQDQSLRLDANRSWTLSQAIRFGQAISDLSIEYIEEPLADPANLETFFAETRMPYALDETLREISCENLTATFPRAAAFIVKPTLLGSLRPIRQWVSDGRTLVISSAFESGVGIACLAQIAQRFAPTTPCGLDTIRWIKQDVLRNSPTVNYGSLQCDHPLSLRTDLLQELT
ncbi:MAG: o-succinylbenzoate synthase [Planctomycetales bacterium]|nr:o-succinylbenzoate synthase [Planctomycetales bacterium]